MGAGRRKAQASKASVGEVLKPPVMARAPVLCTEVIWLETLIEPFAMGPFRVPSEGVHQTSTAYSTLGSATLMKRRLAYFRVIPHDGLVSRRI